eukprot:TRINITY_DN8431_c0_g1_i1.p1 TRINITY_DN8431_c0_g1~~TRINITY_DN8431_c0_g1_i1.p1  ORF type:complete len:170 (+),score=79.16 TRINITY_DN8431_c0_g1_i1:50-511(+)
MASSRVHSGLASEVVVTETCSIPEPLIAKFKKFRMSQTSANSGYIIKINNDSLDVEIDQELSGSIEDLAQELPESAPRFLAYVYRQVHADERVSFPLIFIFYCPPGINTRLNMMYASTKTRLISALQIQKQFDISNSEDLTEDWLKSKLSIFK